MDLKEAKIKTINIIVDRIEFTGYKDGQTPKKSRLSIPLEKFQEKGIIRDDINFIMEALKKDGLVLEYYSTLDMVNESIFPLGKKYYFIENINEIRDSKSFNKIIEKEKKELEQKFENIVYLVPNIKKLRKIKQQVEPIRVIKDDEILSFKLKDNTFSFNRGDIKYFLVRFVVVNYNEDNIYFIKEAMGYVKENIPDVKSRITDIIDNINKSSLVSLLEPFDKGKTFRINPKLLE